MANRVLRDWTTSDKMDLLSPQAEVFFTRLIMKADDYGSFHSNPKLLNSALFPLKDYEPEEINKWVSECVKAGLLILYTVKEKEYVRVENFGQRLRNMRNIFPQPESNSQQLAANCSECPPETKRNETKRNESEKQNTDNTLTIGTGKYQISVTKKYLHENSYIIKGSDGLKHYYEINNSIIGFPDFADKFMRDRNGKVFNEFSHVWNDFDKYVKDQFK